MKLISNPNQFVYLNNKVVNLTQITCFYREFEANRYKVQLSDGTKMEISEKEYNKLIEWFEPLTCYRWIE